MLHSLSLLLAPVCEFVAEMLASQSLQRGNVSLGACNCLKPMHKEASSPYPNQTFNSSLQHRQHSIYVFALSQPWENYSLPMHRSTGSPAVHTYQTEPEVQEDFDASGK